MAKLKIHRKAHTRKGYIRKGTAVSGSHVRDTDYYAEDLGKKGRGKRVIKITHPGSLKAVGYDVDNPESQRHTALRKAERKYGEKSTIGKLHAQSIFRKRTDPKRSKLFAEDRTWVSEQYD